MTPVGASAPGKALVCGEYAVLEGAPAVVAAVGRRVCVTWSDRMLEMPPEVESTLERARAACGPVPGSLVLNRNALHLDRVKLGLGSSAAAAAATAGAVFATRGHDVEDPTVRQRVFACALAGHATVAPRGSGVDVAASTFGGFLRFERRDTDIEIRALGLPEDLVMVLVWTGQAARTSDLLAKVHELEQSDQPRYLARMNHLAALASDFARAFERQSAAEVVQCAGAYAAGMNALGAAAGAPIVEARLSLAGRLAARFSGAAKPCGAGGGDVAIAFFADPGNADAFRLACEDEGLHPVDVSWGAAGVRPR